MQIFCALIPLLQIGQFLFCNSIFFSGDILKYETKIINKTISAVENEKKETAKFHIKQHPTEKSSVVYCIFHDTWGIFHLPVVNIHFLNSDDLYISAMVSCNDFTF